MITDSKSTIHYLIELSIIVLLMVRSVTIIQAIGKVNEQYQPQYQTQGSLGY